jgi:hypothetical protein
MYPKPCPRCPGQLQIDVRDKMPLAICSHCLYFERIPGPYTPDQSHTAKLIGPRHD